MTPTLFFLGQGGGRGVDDPLPAQQIPKTP